MVVPLSRSRGRLGRALVVNALHRPGQRVCSAAAVLAAAALHGCGVAGGDRGQPAGCELAAMSSSTGARALRLGEQRRARSARRSRAPGGAGPSIAKRVDAARAARRLDPSPPPRAWPSSPGCSPRPDALGEQGVETQAARRPRRSHVSASRPGRPTAGAREQLREQHRQAAAVRDGHQHRSLEQYGAGGLLTRSSKVTPRCCPSLPSCAGKALALGLPTGLRRCDTHEDLARRGV